MSPHGIHTRKAIQFRLPPELAARLKAAKDRTGEDMTAIVTRALAAELDRIEQDPGHDHAQ